MLRFSLGSLLLVACGGGGGMSSPPVVDAGVDETRDGSARRDGAIVDADVPDVRTSTGCTAGARSCRDPGHQRVCESVEATTAWIETVCPEGEACLDDRCVPACLDVCALGETREVDGTTQTCALFDAEGSRLSAGTGGHDLARRHLGWIRRHLLANGYVANALFADTSYASATAYTGTVDAAEWTGAYLAAESLRAMTTRSPDAHRNVEAIVERVHELFAVTGTPGSMARIWAPLDGDARLAALYDPADTSHFATTFEGRPAFFHGWTSRDMYAGVAMGLGLAYDATTSERHRELIREVVVTLALELARARTDVPVRVRHHLTGSWQQTDLTFDMQHVVLVPQELTEGRVFIQIGSDAEPDDYGASELRGVREFLPNMTTVLGQVPLVGRLLPPIPRPGSALMLASFFELALHVTEGVPARAAERATLAAHYEANRASWLAVMKQYEYHHDTECWTAYFGMTIAHHPLFTLLRLTDDASFRDELRTNVLSRMRPYVNGHSNAYFDFVAAAQGPGFVSAEVLAETVTQLHGFVPPPKAATPVDNRAAYSANPECANQASRPIDVGARVRRDFAWQHHPFQLVATDVDPRHVYPGADYLLAYWLGRHLDTFEDDAPDTCTRWD
ncbi:MAG: hypothetical protein R3B99_24900 [Polyangiales bacterium]|nr:hypothetical protein [Myxococcales bacterium]MCB9624917.1 hypothetical protein [Sandaracinus sp.]